ncbi:MAG: D-ribose ABC transporter substrate-binding protein [Bifidobacteriaceae bacterium]|jgi:erythritol transport system substrate-binding protein|nr:D-ribose ABC transporter substrate-binding protein [Bifidobacteriaceae bacterium]
MRRKLAARVAAGALIAFMGACSSSNPSSPASEPANETSEQTPGDSVQSTEAGDAPEAPADADGGLVPIITTVLANPYWDAEADTAKAALEALGFTTWVDAHNNDPQRQAELVDAAISQKAVAIVLDPAGADESIGVVTKATDAGIPVFLINAEINQEGVAKAQIIANNAQGAELGGQYFAEQMGGKGKFVELFGNPTDNNAPVRSNAYHSVIEQYPDLELLQTETANWNRDEGFQKMEILLQAHPDLTGVLSGNDEMALGAIAAIEAAGKVPGKDVLVMGFDGSPDAVEAIESGKLLGTVLQPIVAETEELVKQLGAYLKSGSTGADAEKQAMDCVLITPDNTDEYSLFNMS